MACPELEDIERAECLNNVGGLELSISVWKSKHRKTGSTIDVDEWVFTLLEYEDPTPTLKLPVTVSYHKDTATLTQSMAGEVATANSTNTVTLSVTINAQDFDKSRAINNMAVGQQGLDIALAYKNGTKWILTDMQLLTVDANSGATSSEGSNYVLTFTGEFSHLLYGIEDSDFEQLVSTGSTTTP